MCYSNSSTSSVIDLTKKYGKKAPKNLSLNPIYFSNGFDFPLWPIITKDENIKLMNWGLIPSWFKNENTNEIAKNTLNAKCETLKEKSAFKSVLNSKRCIIPSTGFFEWHTKGKIKIPYLIQLKNEQPFAMAGIFDEWINPISRNPVFSFSIITCQANTIMSEIHNTKKRMPVILSDSNINKWLNNETFDDVNEVLSPYKSEEMKAHEINKKIILSADPNNPEILKPFQNEIYFQGDLFD
jgi:putative SOS response-associated peptidase YedK